MSINIEIDNAAGCMLFVSTGVLNAFIPLPKVAMETVLAFEGGTRAILINPRQPLGRDSDCSWSLEQSLLK